MFLVNSRFSLVSAALNANPQGVSRLGPPFSRSYGGILPNSLTTIHSIASVFSTSPPESVWGTGGSNLARNFSWQHRITLLPAYAVTIKPRALTGRIYHSPALRSSTWTTIATRRLPSCVLPSLTYYQIGSRVPPPAPTPEGARLWVASGAQHPRIQYWAVLRRFRNINRMSIDYACRPRLRSRLTQGRLA